MAATTAADTLYGRSVRAASVIRFWSPWLPGLSYNMVRHKSSNDSRLRSRGVAACATGGNGRARAPWGSHGREDEALKRVKTTRPSSDSAEASQDVSRELGGAIVF